MAFYDKFPYTNFQELNLDEIIRRVVAVEEGLQFVIDNASLKYADPIQWNITSQYQANTVVIDPATNIAYLSTKPVPANILITNTDYWTPIFNLTPLLADLDNKIDNVESTLQGEITAIENTVSALNDSVSEGILYITPEMFGAAGDGVTDDTAAIQAAINSQAATGRAIYGFKKYHLANAVRVTHENARLTFTDEITCDTDFIEIDANRGVYVFNKITGSNTGTGIHLKAGSGGRVSSFNKFYFTELLDFLNGVYFDSDPNYGIQYNTVDFSYIKCGYCIRYRAGAAGWVTQNTFEHGRVSGQYGIYVDENASMDWSNGNVFYDIGFEDITVSAMKLFKVSGSFFKDIRLLENAEIASYFIDMNSCQGNHFSGAINLSFEKVRDANTCAESNLAPIYFNHFDCSRIDETYGGGYRGTRMITYNDNKFLVDTPRPKDLITASERNYDARTESYTNNGFRVNVGTSGGNAQTYTFPWFFRTNENAFYIGVLYKNGNINLVWPDGTSILDTSSMTAGHVYRIETAGSVKIAVQVA